MVFSRKISEETRALVKFLSIEKKYSIHEIAKKVNISKSTVGRYLRSDEIKGSIRPRTKVQGDLKSYPSMHEGF